MVNSLEQHRIGRDSAVGLDVELVARFFEPPDQCREVLAQRLAAGQAHPVGRMVRHLGGNVLDVHSGEAVKLGVAERAAQVATRQAHKGGRLAHAQPLALNRVEYVVDLQDAPGVAPYRQAIDALFGRLRRAGHGVCSYAKGSPARLAAKAARRSPQASHAPQAGRTPS